MGRNEASCDCAVIHEDILQHVKDEMVPENELDHAYWQCIVMEFLRESIMRGRREEEETQTI